MISTELELFNLLIGFHGRFYGGPRRGKDGRTPRLGCTQYSSPRAHHGRPRDRAWLTKWALERSIEAASNPPTALHGLRDRRKM